MGKLADYLKNYNNSGTAQGYISAVYHFIDFIYGKQRKLTRVNDQERVKYEKLIDKYLKENGIIQKIWGNSWYLSTSDPH